jgi:uncharacterized protein DUF1573
LRAARLLVALAMGASVANADAPAGARIAVDPPSFDFGSVRAERLLQKDLALRNFGDAELVITKVSTTCGCTVAGGYRKRVPPGGSTTLRISFTTPAKAGPTAQTVTLQTNDPVRPRLDVMVKATVVAPAKPD